METVFNDNLLITYSYVGTREVKLPFAKDTETWHCHRLSIINLLTNVEITHDSVQSKKIPKIDERLLMEELLIIAADAYVDRERMYKYKEKVYLNKEKGIEENLEKPSMDRYIFFRRVYDGDIRELIEEIRDKYDIYLANLLAL